MTWRRTAGLAAAIIACAAILVLWNRVASGSTRRIPTARVQRAEDAVALLHARYDVRRAELETKSNELVSAIQAQQNVLLLEEARQRLAQVEKDVRSHGETNRAAGNVLKEKRNKAQLAVQVAEKNIASLQIRAPFDGFVVIRQNFDALGGFCCVPGMT